MNKYTEDKREAENKKLQIFEALDSKTPQREPP